jgi:pentatricopeptide repeat protein
MEELYELRKYLEAGQYDDALLWLDEMVQVFR